MRYLFTLLLLFVGIPTMALAQTLAPDLSIEAAPSNPQPGQSVTLTARSYGMDVNQATLSWNYNGSSIAQGAGKTSITITAPQAGNAGIVTVTAISTGTPSANASIVLRPASIDLLWEAADAYTPPFYKGKALLPIGGLLRVTAIPSTSTPKNLSFSWQRNGSALENLSGVGKSSIVIRNNILNPQEKVDVSASGGVFTGGATTRLTPSDPIAVAYENRDGFITYTKGFARTITLGSSGTILHIEPYYFSLPKNNMSDLLITSIIDGQTVSSSQQNELALSHPATARSSILNITITTVAYSLQHLEKSFTLLFN